MRQLCNFAYALLIKDRTPPQIAELEVLLSEPQKREEMIDRQNAEAMKALTGMPGGLLIPPRRPGAK